MFTHVSVHERQPVEVDSNQTHQRIGNTCPIEEPVVSFR